MKLFISYRRDDSGYITDRIYEYLVPRAGRSSVFRDINSIDPGVNFVSRIQQSIAECDVLLVVIGDRWLQPDNTGQPRLHSADDFVRLEIRSAIGIQVPVIPILVENCRMPAASDLPSEISSIAYLNAMRVRRDPDFLSDMRQLLGFLRISENRTSSTPSQAASLDFGNLGI